MRWPLSCRTPLRTLERSRHIRAPGWIRRVPVPHEGRAILQRAAAYVGEINDSEWSKSPG